jgi:8-oxo-dGTP pyrophosphatase MutT (NUDIX family)
MSDRWNPSVTVAAILEKDGRYLLIEEHTQEGLRLNNPAGHLDPGESLIEACARECLEETAHPFQPQQLVGIYQSRFHRAAKNGRQAEEITYVRFAFTGDISHRTFVRVCLSIECTEILYQWERTIFPLDHEDGAVEPGPGRLNDPEFQPFLNLLF